MDRTGEMASGPAGGPAGGNVARDAAQARRAAPVRVALIALASDHGIRGELGLLFGRRAELHLARVSAPGQLRSQKPGRHDDWHRSGGEVDGLGQPRRRGGLWLHLGHHRGRARIRWRESLQTALPGVPATTPSPRRVRPEPSGRPAHRTADALPGPHPSCRGRISCRATAWRSSIERGLDIAIDREITAYPAEDLRADILKLDRKRADALFISCTSLRVAGCIAELE